MGVALALDATALCVVTKYGHFQRSITLPVRIARVRKSDPPVPQLETIVGMVDITKAVIRAVEDYRTRYVGIKGYAHDAKWQVHQLGELAGVIKTQLWLLHKIEPQVVPPSAAKKCVVGSTGKVTWEEVREAARGQRAQPQSDLELSAYTVARYMFGCVVKKEKEFIYAE
jgi:hypothetical protein